MGLAAGDEEPRERLGHDDRVGLRAATVEVAQRGADLPALSHGPCQLGGRLARPAS